MIPRDTRQAPPSGTTVYALPSSTVAAMSTPSQVALRLTDVIHIIFKHVLSSETSPFVSGLERSTLAAAARVCGAWKAPALKMLWRNIDTLLPLFRLLSTVMLDPSDDSDSSDSDDSNSTVDHDAALVSRS